MRGAAVSCSIQPVLLPAKRDRGDDTEDRCPRCAATLAVQRLLRQPLLPADPHLRGHDGQAGRRRRRVEARVEASAQGTDSRFIVTNLTGSPERSEEHTSELQSLMRISYAVFCLKKKQTETTDNKHTKTL